MKRLLLALLLFASPAWATNYERYVDAGSTGGDGTTTKITGTDAAFASLNAALAAMNGVGQPPLDLVTGGHTYKIWLQSTDDAHLEDTTPVVSPAPITNASYFVTAEAVAASWAGTAWDATKYRLSVTNAVALGTSTNDYFVMRGFQARVAAADTSARYVLNISANSGYGNLRTIDSCLLIHETTGTTYNGPVIYQGGHSGGMTVHVLNSILIARSTRNNASNVVLAALGSASPSDVFNVYNCTVSGGKYAIRQTASSGGTLTVKNTYAGNSITADYSTAGATLAATYSASEDATGDDFGATGCLTSIAWSTTNFENVTGGSFDMHLKSGSTLVGAGTVTSGESAPLNFTDDIAQNYRGATTWDIGADEYADEAAAGGGMAWKTYDEVIY